MFQRVLAFFRIESLSSIDQISLLLLLCVLMGILIWSFVAKHRRERSRGKAKVYYRLSEKDLVVQFLLVGVSVGMVSCLLLTREFFLALLSALIAIILVVWNRRFLAQREMN